MSERLVIDKGTLTGIADAIREKSGSTETMLVSALASAISNLPSGSGLPSAITTGAFTLASDTAFSDGIQIEHGINADPLYYAILAENISDIKSAKASMISVTMMCGTFVAMHTSTGELMRSVSGGNSAITENGITTITGQGTQAPNYYWRSGYSYRWFMWF